MIAERISMFGMMRLAILLFFTLAFGWLGTLRAWAQASQLDDGPAPPPGATAPAPAPEEPAAPAAPVWDPLRAMKSMEVGSYYLKVGNYDAAISRFEEAASAQPGLAKPYLLLGKTYEKKNDPKKTVAAYEKYLELFPAAPDRRDVLKQIAKQASRIPKQTNSSSSR